MKKLLLLFIASVIIITIQAADAPKKLVSRLSNGNYRLNIRDETKEFFKDFVNDGKECDLCRKEGADTLWLGGEDCAHAACITLVQPLEEIFDRYTTEAGFEKHGMAYALSHARAYGSLEMQNLHFHNIVALIQTKPEFAKRYMHKMAVASIEVTKEEMLMPEIGLFPFLEISHKDKDLFLSDKKEDPRPGS